MKNNKKYLISIIIVVIVLLAALILKITKNKAADLVPAAKNISAKEVQAQSYLAGKTPALNKDDMIFGSSEAVLKIFAYEDYSNLYSANLADTLERLRQENNGRLAIVVRPYILESSPLSKIAAQVMICAREQEKWKEMRALLFANVKNRQLNASDFLIYAKNAGLKEKDFATCLTNVEKSGKIEQAQQEAETYGVLGAPTMFIGEELILGARPYDDYTDSSGDQIEGLGGLIKRLIE